MQFMASHRYAPISPRKARLVIDAVRGLPVNEALEILDVTHRRAAPMIAKVIKSAVANAAQTDATDAADLVVCDARVDEGGLRQGRKRFRAGPMGRGMTIRKKASHIRIVLETVEKSPRPRRRARKAATGEPAPAGSGTPAAPDGAEKE